MIDGRTGEYYVGKFKNGFEQGEGKYIDPNAAVKDKEQKALEFRHLFYKATAAGTMDDVADCMEYVNEEKKEEERK